MRRFFTSIVVAMLWLAAGTSPSTALENLRVFRGVLILEGKIESGDYLSVRNFLRDESNFKKISGGVFLASPGGSVLEALKIGRLIRELRLSTEAPASPPPDRRDISAPLIRGRDLSNSRRYDCVSACFFLYVAGIYRTLNWAGRLGIHQPRMEQIREGLTEGDIANASARVRNAIKDYMESMNVPEKYLELMYSVPPNEVRWITQEEFDADLRGYVPEVRRILNERCGSLSEAEPHVRQCITQVKAELVTAAWQNAFRRK